MYAILIDHLDYDQIFMKKFSSIQSLKKYTSSESRIVTDEGVEFLKDIDVISIHHTREEAKAHFKKFE